MNATFFNSLWEDLKQISTACTDLSNVGKPTPSQHALGDCGAETSTPGSNTSLVEQTKLSKACTDLSNVGKPTPSQHAIGDCGAETSTPGSKILLFGNRLVCIVAEDLLSGETIPDERQDQVVTSLLRGPSEDSQWELLRALFQFCLLSCSYERFLDQWSP